MKKATLFMFALIIIMLQFNLYAIQNTDVNINLSKFIALIPHFSRDLGMTIAYIFPVLGIIISIINLFTKINLSVITLVLGLVGFLYNLYIYNLVGAINGSLYWAFYVELAAYFAVMVTSVLSIRIKE